RLERRFLLRRKTYSE
ncbi:hypothetical protein CPC197_0262B, partial [Chlamydia psittaci C1/97]